MSQSKDYVLGTDQTELERLQLQHNLWQNHLIRLWDKSEFKKCSSILELGCGPGFTTGDLNLYTQQNAKITAVDISDNFLNYLNSKNFKNVTTVKSYIESLDLENKKFDAAFCRWLMIFIPDINKAVQKISEHLKPGAVFSMQEYIAYDSFSISTGESIMKKIVDAIFKSWMDQGGFPNQGRRLPKALELNGFEVLEIEPIARVCRPHEPLWQWPETFFRSFIPRLVSTGYLSIEDEKEFFQVWSDLKKTPGSFCMTPTVVNIISRKI
jgi:ubiquinone/menaquinone biosynthesis C-methylase UbiE